MEYFIFSHFEDRDGICAILWIDGEPIAFNRASLEERLNNLQKGGWPHDQTAQALALWPPLPDTHDEWCFLNDES
jgi:hypothetical protein